jgi:hypothetical protein
MPLALSTGRSIRVAANMPTAWEERKLVCRPRRRSLCHRRTSLTFELVTASLKPALA